MKKSPRISLFFSAGLAALVVASCLSFPAQSDSALIQGNPAEEVGSPKFAPGELIVKLKKEFDLSAIESLNRRFQVTSVKEIFPEKPSPLEKLAELKRRLQKLEAQSHSRWYWWQDKESKEARAYEARIAKEKEELGRQIAMQEELIQRLERRQQRATEGAEPASLEKTYLLQVDKGTDIPTMQRMYEAHPAVEYAQPNRIATLYRLPNDAYVDPDQDGIWSVRAWGQEFEDLWGLKMVRAVEAWEVTGSNPGSKGQGTLVAVVDSGLDYTHVDIQGNVFVNGSEDINANGRLDPAPAAQGGDFDGLDNDGNGIVDDVSGYDFTTCAEFGFFGCAQPKARDGDPRDGNGHGTHVAGTIAAVADNSLGIAGVAPKAKILPVKGFNDEGGSLLADLAVSLRYAADMGADVINNSWGFSTEVLSDPLLEDAIRYAHSRGAVVVFAAGNEDQDVSRQFPQKMSEVITVAAVDHLGRRSSFSNYGDSVDLAAPGGEDNTVLSLLAAGSRLFNDPFAVLFHVGFYYIRLSGTSMAAPHVTGVAALLLGKEPTLTQAEVFSRLINGSAPFATLPSVPIGAGIVDAGESLLNRPSATVISLKSFPEDRYILPNQEWELSLRLSFRNMSAPFTATLSTSREDLRITRFQTQFTQEGNSRFANNDTQRFRILYTGNSPALLGDILFTLAIDGTNLSLPVTVPLRIIQLPGWPRLTGHTVDSSAAVADLDGDGALEVVIGSGNFFDRGKVFAFHADGTAVSGWPQIAGVFVDSSPAIADLDGDGSLEIVIGAADLEPIGGGLSLIVGKVFAWHRDGRPVAGWPVRAGDAQVDSSPAIVDLNQDGRLEVVVGSWDNRVFAWHPDGSLIPGWPFRTRSLVHASPSVANLDSDPQLEVVFYSGDGKVHVLNHDGTLVSGWPQEIGRFPASSPAIADLDRDGRADVLISGVDKVYAFHGDGTALAGWPVTALGSGNDSSPAVADLTGDGILEVIVGSSVGKVYAWHADGSSVSGWPVATGDRVDSSPAVADLDGDDRLEVVVGSRDSKVYAWHADGTLVLGFPVEAGDWVESSPAVADLDGNGTLEVIVGSFNGRVSAWTMPTSARERAPWPMFRHDLNHTGLYQMPPPPNRPPVLETIGNRTVNEGDLLEFVVSATDPDGDLVTLGLGTSSHPDAMLVDVSGDGVIGPRDVDQIRYILWGYYRPSDEEKRRADVNHDGRVDFQDLDLARKCVQPMGERSTWSFDVRSGTFRWRPSYDQAGLYEVTFSASDGSSSSRQGVSLTVNNVNRQPDLAPIVDKKFNEGSGFTWKPTTASDFDGDPLTFTASGLPTWASLNPSTGEITGTIPRYLQVNVYPFTLTVRDTGGLSDSKSGRLLVNRNPRWTTPVNQTAEVGKRLRFKVDATDPDGDALVFKATLLGQTNVLPPEATFNTRTGVFDWTPPANQAGIRYSLVLSATDPGNLSVSTTITVEVKRPPQPRITSASISGDQLTISGEYFGGTNARVYFNYWQLEWRVIQWWRWTWNVPYWTYRQLTLTPTSDSSDTRIVCWLGVSGVMFYRNVRVDRDGRSSNTLYIW